MNKNVVLVVLTSLLLGSCTTKKVECDYSPLPWDRDCVLMTDELQSPHAAKQSQTPDAPTGGPSDDPPSNPPSGPPSDPPNDPPNQPKKEKHPNAGRGNGPEGDPDVDPGNSGEHNQGGD